jgi:hypothetical protein
LFCVLLSNNRLDVNLKQSIFPDSQDISANLWPVRDRRTNLLPDPKGAIYPESDQAWMAFSPTSGLHEVIGLRGVNQLSATLAPLYPNSRCSHGHRSVAASTPTLGELFHLSSLDFRHYLCALHCFHPGEFPSHIDTAGSDVVKFIDPFEWMHARFRQAIMLYVSLLPTFDTHC